MREKKTEKKKEYRQMIAEAYLFLVLLVHPLYMKDGLVHIGQAKYIFYQNVSLFFCVIVIGLLIITCEKEKRNAKIKYSSTDLAVIMHCIAGCISFCCSPYKETAFWGFSGWNMGLFTQFMMLFGYFLVSRWYQGDNKAWYFAVAGLAAVSFFTVSNRMGDDPLHIYGNMDWWEWNRRNLLSTIGNINWLCSYLLTVFPILLYIHRVSIGIGHVLSWFGIWISMAAILLQGSMSGVFAMGIILVLLLYLSLAKSNDVIRWMEAVLTIPLTCCVLRIFQVDLILPIGSQLRKIFTSFFWLPTMGLGLCIYGILWWLKKTKRTEMGWNGAFLKKIFGGTVCVGGVILAIVLVICQYSEVFWKLCGGYAFLKLDESWGSLRGALWAQSLAAYFKGGILRMVAGVGADCFACYMYDMNFLTITMEGQWTDAIYANAHNEFLTMLINEGVLGLTTYVAIFGSVFFRCWRKWQEKPALIVGLLVISGYCANNFFAFQQVVSTPLLFLVLGICENQMRQLKKG